MCPNVSIPFGNAKLKLKITTKTDFSKYKIDLSDHGQTGLPGFNLCYLSTNKGINFSRLIVTNLEYYTNL